MPLVGAGMSVTSLCGITQFIICWMGIWLPAFSVVPKYQGMLATPAGTVAGAVQKRPRQAGHFGLVTVAPLAASPMANVLDVPSVMSRILVMALMPKAPRSFEGIE